MEDNKKPEEGFSIEKSQTAIKIIGLANNMFGQEVQSVSDKMPSAAKHLMDNTSATAPLFTSSRVVELMESFASLAIKNERQKWEELEQQNITLLRENEEFRSQIRKMRLENPLKPFLKDKNRPLSCKKCGDYFGINIDHKCFKCLEPLF